MCDIQLLPLSIKLTINKHTYVKDIIKIEDILDVMSPDVTT